MTKSDGQEFIGKTLTVLWEPYGPNTFVVDKVTRHTYKSEGREVEYFDVEGIVTEGSTTSFLWGASSTKSNVGLRRSETVRRDELEKGFARKIAM